jgi:nucleotide-binding universal stress UspA family protein
MKVVVWVVEGTWQGCIDGALRLVPHDAEVTLLHVAPGEAGDITEAAAGGLLGRGPHWHRPRSHFDEVAEEESVGLLQAAAARFGRPTELARRRGRPEREVVSVAALGADLLVLARDGDLSRLGPHSLGHATRFVVDHAPCPVLLVWPDGAPSLASVPPPPPRPR